MQKRYISETKILYNMFCQLNVSESTSDDKESSPESMRLNDMDSDVKTGYLETI